MPESDSIFSLRKRETFSPKTISIETDETFPLSERKRFIPDGLKTISLQNEQVKVRNRVGLLTAIKDDDQERSVPSGFTIRKHSKPPKIPKLANN